MEKRIIKFRAWLSGKHNSLTFTKNSMDYDVTLSPEGYWCDVESKWDIHGSYKTIPVMQFTGLTDKNGKEVYEGDLVKNGDELCKVVYEAPNFSLRSIKQKTEWNIDFHGKEVVGNIYENPELI